MKETEVEYYRDENGQLMVRYCANGLLDGSEVMDASNGGIRIVSTRTEEGRKILERNREKYGPKPRCKWIWAAVAAVVAVVAVVALAML